MHDCSPDLHNLPFAGCEPVVPADQERACGARAYVQEAAHPVPLQPGAELGQGARHAPERRRRPRCAQLCICLCASAALATLCAALTHARNALSSHYTPQEFERWLGDRVQPVVVDDTRAPAVKSALQEFRGFARPGAKPKVLVMSYTTYRRAHTRARMGGPRTARLPLPGTSRHALPSRRASSSAALLLARLRRPRVPCPCRMHKAEVAKLGIDVCMCDEAHQLKNADAQITQAVAGLTTKRRLLISGAGRAWARSRPPCPADISPHTLRRTNTPVHACAAHTHTHRHAHPKRPVRVPRGV